MSERFSVRLRSECDEVIYSFFDGDNPLDLDNIVDLLNEQQATITELERKLNKYAKIGEEQLKQIIELQEENEQLRKQVAECKMILRQHEFAEKEGFQ